VLNKLIRDKQSQEVLEEARKQKNSLYAGGKHNIAVEPQLAEFFIRDAKKTVSTLMSIYENNCRRKDDLPALIINVHAMKSALANVGENELSEKASELEQAGRNQNISLILKSLPAFLEDLNKVIEKFIPDEEGEESGINNVDRAFLQEKLLSIQNACASYDKKAAKAALSELKAKNYPKAARDILSAIAEHLLHSEFDEAASLAREIHFS